jgi:hypothetical protein
MVVGGEEDAEDVFLFDRHRASALGGSGCSETAARAGVITAPQKQRFPTISRLSGLASLPLGETTT